MGQYSIKIPDWPEDERPRERMLKHGTDALSEAELLAIVLRTGNGKNSAVDLARHILNKYNGLRGLDGQSIEELLSIKGIGLAKAAQIKAALEIAKRLAAQKWRVQDRLQSSEDVYRIIHLRMRDLGREEFRVLFLTARHEILAEKKLFEGSLMESVVSPREIILTAVQQSAASVVLLHNHPSGDPSPSPQDKNVTTKIVKACRYVDIQVLDHIIIGKDSYYSFADHGLLSA
ncbi:MAG: DNA repair protein RadC [Actinobacteria bacterium]|nr:DNA repair protein RadC [Actinomycetota bacterium]